MYTHTHLIYTYLFYFIILSYRCWTCELQTKFCSTYNENKETVILIYCEYKEAPTMLVLFEGTSLNACL